MLQSVAVVAVCCSCCSVLQCVGIQNDSRSPFQRKFYMGASVYFQVDLQYTYGTHCPRCTYGTHTVHIRYTYGTHTVHIRYTYGTHTVHIRYTYGRPCPRQTCGRHCPSQTLSQSEMVRSQLTAKRTQIYKVYSCTWVGEWMGGRVCVLVGRSVGVGKVSAVRSEFLDRR